MKACCMSVCSFACVVWVFPCWTARIREWPRSMFPQQHCGDNIMYRHTDSAPETSLNPLNPSEPNGIVYNNKGVKRRSLSTNKCVIILAALNNLQ